MKRLLPLIMGISLLLISCTDKVKPGSIEVKRESVTGVTLAKASCPTVDAFYETSGTVAARTVSVVGARTMGTVISVKVREGDRVKEGQELIVLDDRDLAQKVAAAEHGYNEAHKALEEAEQNKHLAGVTYNRYKNLFDDKIITGQEMDQTETRKKVADLEYERAEEAVNRVRAQLEEVRITRSFTRIVAPHNGLIVEKKIDLGSLAAPGSPLLVLEDTSNYRVEAALDQGIVPFVRVGAPVVVILPPGEKRITATIGEIVPTIDPATRSFTVKIDVKDPSLRSGLYVKVLVPQGKRQGLLVPQSAIVEKGQLTGVYVVDDRGVMTYRMVRAGRTYGDRVELLSGVRDGETIAIAGLDKAIDGGMVSLSKEGH